MNLEIPRAAGLNNETGFALATAMFTLAVIGALVAGSFLPARLEQQSGRNVSYASQAREAAEAGLVEAVAGLGAPTLEHLVRGVVVDLGTMTLGEMVTVRTTVARLTSRVLIVRSYGTRHDASGGELATRTLGLFVRVGAAVTGSTPEDGALPAVIPLAERSWVRLY
jgi:Tfp pilus assembly protein PilX